MLKNIVIITLLMSVVSLECIKPKVEESPVHRAVLANHHDCISEEAQAQLHAITVLAWHGDTLVSPLHLAAMNGYTECARALLGLGANPNQQDSKGVTAVYHAASFGHDECLEVLLQAGGKVEEAFNPSGYSALQIAAGKGFLECVRILIRYQADLNFIGGKATAPAVPIQITALIAAASKGMVGTGRILINSGAQVMLAIDSGQTAVHVAAQEGFPDFLEMLLDEGGDANAQTKTGGTPLISAAHSGNVRCLELLLSRGAHVRHTDPHSKITALHIAAGRGHYEAVQTLIAAGANPSALDSEGRSPLMLTKDPQCIMLLTELEGQQLILAMNTPEGNSDECKARLIFIYEIRHKTKKAIDEANRTSRATQSTRACNQCGKADAPNMCSRCQAVYYCSAECQTKKWSTHKKDCHPK